jgi:hypothetical protein
MRDLQVSWKSITNANQTHMLQASVGMSDMRLPADNIRGRGHCKLTFNLVTYSQNMFSTILSYSSSQITIDLIGFKE